MVAICDHSGWEIARKFWIFISTVMKTYKIICIIHCKYFYFSRSDMAWYENKTLKISTVIVLQCPMIHFYPLMMVVVFCNFNSSPSQSFAVYHLKYYCSMNTPPHHLCLYSLLRLWKLYIFILLIQYITLLFISALISPLFWCTTPWSIGCNGSWLVKAVDTLPASGNKNGLTRPNASATVMADINKKIYTCVT